MLPWGGRGACRTGLSGRGEGVKRDCCHSIRPAGPASSPPIPRTLSGATHKQEEFRPLCLGALFVGTSATVRAWRAGPGISGARRGWPGRRGTAGPSGWDCCCRGSACARLKGDPRVSRVLRGRRAPLESRASTASTVTEVRRVPRAPRAPRESRESRELRANLARRAQTD